MTATSANMSVAMMFMSRTSNGAEVMAPPRVARACRRCTPRGCSLAWGGPALRSYPASDGSLRVERGRGQHLQAEILVRDARRTRRHRHQRVTRHARRGVQFQQERLAVARADHDVGT